MQSQSNLSRRAAAAMLVAMTMCLPAAFAAEKSFDRTLSVNGPVTLRVSTGSGYIRVSPGSDNQVHIVGRVKSNNSWWGGSSDDAVAKVAANPPIDQAGNIIRVGDDHGNDWTHHVSIDYEITTPAHTMLVAESGSGDLQVSNIDGTVKAHTGSGSIRADKLGSGSRLETGSGSLEISGQPTAPWKLETGSGEISLRLGNNAHFTLDAETGSGSVKSDPPLTMTTHGSIDKHHVSGTVNGGGPTIKAETGSGDIHIQ